MSDRSTEHVSLEDLIEAKKILREAKGAPADLYDPISGEWLVKNNILTTFGELVVVHGIEVARDLWSNK